MRHHRRHADLDSPIWWAAVLGRLALAAVLLVAWLAQALIVLPVVAVARLRHNDGMATRWMRSLEWLL